MRIYPEIGLHRMRERRPRSEPGPQVRTGEEGAATPNASPVYARGPGPNQEPWPQREFTGQACRHLVREDSEDKE